MRGDRTPSSFSDHGAAAVEFALVSIPLLLLVFGIVNYGVVFSQQLTLNSAARDGARLAVVQPVGGTGLTCSQIVTAARDANSGLAMDKTDVGVTVLEPDGSTACAALAGSTAVTGSPGSHPCDGSTASSPPLAVRLTYASNTLVPIIPPSVFDLKATGRFACEYS